MKIERFFTVEDKNVYETVEWERRRCEIKDSSGNVVFEMDNVEVPKSWSQLATDILASKYMRRDGVNKDGFKGELEVLIIGIGRKRQIKLKSCKRTMLTSIHNYQHALSNLSTIL